MKFWLILLCIISFGVNATPQYAFSLYETPKYPPSFDHFDYVNPNAPKGGKLTYATLGTFDTLNPFVIQGMAASGLYLTYDTLFKESDDEPDTLYPLVATSLELFPQKKEVVFTLNPNARFSDDSPITSQDIAFSFDILKTKGRPTYRYYLENVQNIETPDSHTIRIILTKWDKTFIPILATLPILSHAFWEKRDFTKTSLVPPVSSGPYIIEKVVPGKSVLYKRNPHYWAKDLNVNKGFDNFDWVQADYYRDTSVILEALKTGAVDLRLENEARRWQYSLTYPQVKKGHLKRLEFKHQLPSGMQGFVFNLRRPIFQDIHVREALALLFDFDWTNTHLFNGLYKRTTSFFDNSYLKAPPTPTEAEKKLLMPFQKDLPADIFTGSYSLTRPTSTREVLQKALDLFAKAGWHLKDGYLQKNGQPFRFEILLETAGVPMWERVILPYQKTLQRLGIELSLRAVDAPQYEHRLNHFDYDMIISVYPQPLIPSSEQRAYWHSETAQTIGSYNYAGIQNPVVDALITHIEQASTKEELLTAVHALDRVLYRFLYIIPHWHSPLNRYLVWDKLSFPKQAPLKGTSTRFWWSNN